MHARLKELVDVLQKDNFSENGNLSVDYKNGELTINGKKQPDDVLKKYASYLDAKKDFNFSIKVNQK